ncbi:MAG: MFS transporter [Paracoccus sp. (in: a-proteobacteria)]
MFGFALIALGIGAPQLMLDHGAELDWFQSTKIWIELDLALTGFWVATIHIMTAARPFIEPRIFADRNFSAGLAVIFVIGMVLMASMALLPPLLSRIYGYPVITVGLIMAPRGMGTMISMILVGQLMKLVDPRALIVTGLLLTAWSVHEMSGLSPLMGSGPIIQTGIIQGMGMGLVFVPLSAMAFAPMALNLRADGTALFSLMRNIGSSIGISVLTYMLTVNTAVNQSELMAPLSFTNPEMLQLGRMFAAMTTAQAATVTSSMVSQQALFIAYLDDFVIMMWMCLLTIPLVALLRRPSAGAAMQVAHAE